MSQHKTQTEQREQFSSKYGFVLAAAASAVGIGNLVAFPVKATQSGGALFLLIYIACIALICVPVMMAEIALGRHTRRNPIGAYDSVSNNNLLWKMGGWLSVITPFMIAVFYMVITVWLLGYFIGAVTGNLEAMAHENYFAEFINSNAVFAPLVILILAIGIVLNGGVQRGVERLSRIIMPVLVCMLLILAAFVLTLDNAFIGVKYYLVPDFSSISFKVVSNALNHAFFSLSLGMGILITYGSYMTGKDSHNGQGSIRRSVVLTAFIDTLVAFLAGLLILPAIFAFNPTIDTQTLSTSSVSLVFTFLPKIFLSLQTVIGYAGASIFASLFFLLVLFAAITSQVSILQVPLSALQDQLKYSRLKSLLLLALVALVLVLACTVSFGRVDYFTSFAHYAGQTKSIFDLIVDLFYETILPLNGLLVCLFVSYRWKKSAFNNELNLGDAKLDNSFIQKYLNLSLLTFIPVILTLVVINTVCIIFLGMTSILDLF